MGLLSTIKGWILPSAMTGVALTKDAASGSRLNYARSLDKAGRTAEAQAIYWAMLEADPSELGAAQNLSDVLIRELQYGDAIAVLAVILDQYPTFSPLWCNLSAALSAIGDHQRALEAAERAVRTDPGNSMAYYNRGKCYWHDRRNQEAIADYEKAAVCDPSNVEIAQQLHISKFAVSDAVHDFGPVKHEMRAHGAYIADGMEIAATLMCPHCGGHFPSLRASENSKCLRCGDFTCGKAECIPCHPYQAVLEEAATAAAKTG